MRSTTNVGPASCSELQTVLVSKCDTTAHSCAKYLADGDCHDLTRAHCQRDSAFGAESTCIGCADDGICKPGGACDLSTSLCDNPRKAYADSANAAAPATDVAALRAGAMRRCFAFQPSH
jgi:hypothetical protein